MQTWSGQVIRLVLSSLVLLNAVGCVVQNPANSKVDVEASAKLTYKPPFAPVKISIDNKCRVSVSASYGIVTPIGAFEVSVSETLKPHDGKMHVIIRRPNSEFDEVYELDLGTKVTFDDPQILVGMRFETPQHLILEISGCTARIPEDPIRPTPVKPERPEGVGEVPVPSKPTPPLGPEPEQTHPQASPIENQYPDQAVDLETFARGLKAHSGVNLARVVHPVTGVEYYLNFWLPSGVPAVRSNRHQVKLFYPGTVVTINFTRKGGVDIDYGR